MKTKLVILLLLLCHLATEGQVSDLMKLASGKLVYSNILTDSNDKLYGYFYLYESDNDNSTQKIEYVILDKNLNRVLNGEFTAAKNKWLTHYKYDDCTLIDDKIILTKDYDYTPVITSGYGSPYIYLASTFRTISMTDNTVSPEYMYKDGKIVEAPSDLSELKSQNKKIATKNIVSAFSSENNSGFFITQYNKNNDNEEEKEIKFYDKDLNFKWNYEYNAGSTSKSYNSIRLQHFKNNTLYLTETSWEGSTVTAYKLVALDFKTGKKKYEYKLESPDCEYVHRLWFRDIKGKLTICGDYMKNTDNLKFSYKKRLGFYRIVLNEDGSEAEKKYVQWTDMAPHCSFKERGQDMDKFTLNPKKFLMFENGKVSIITEQYRPEVSGVALPIPLVNFLVYALTNHPQRTGNMIVLNFDKDFNLQKADTIRKELTKSHYTDYLFSKYIQNDTAAVFFYRNTFTNKETNKEEMILGINVLSNGKIQEEKIPLFSKDKYFIDVLPAKDGYILLREYNEKAKYNQLRLEKLNYE